MINFENFTGSDGLIDIKALFNSIKPKKYSANIYREYTTYNSCTDWRDNGTNHSEIFEHIETDYKNEILRRVAELDKTANEHLEEFFYARDCATNKPIR